MTPEGVDGQLSWLLPQRGSVGVELQKPISSVPEGMAGKSMVFDQVPDGSPKVTKARICSDASPIFAKLFRAHSAPWLQNRKDQQQVKEFRQSETETNLQPEITILVWGQAEA